MFNFKYDETEPFTIACEFITREKILVFKHFTDWTRAWPLLRRALDITKACHSEESAERKTRSQVILTMYYAHLQQLKLPIALTYPTPPLLLTLDPFRGMLSKSNLTTPLNRDAISTGIRLLQAKIHRLNLTLHATLLTKARHASPRLSSERVSLEHAHLVFQCTVCDFADTAPHLLFGFGDAMLHCHGRDPQVPPIEYHSTASAAVKNLVHRLRRRARGNSTYQPTPSQLDLHGALFTCEFCPVGTGDRLEELAKVMTWRQYVRIDHLPIECLSDFGE